MEKKLRRIHYKKIGTEAKVLRFMRKSRGLSMRAAAKKVKKTDGWIGQKEHGRADIYERDIDLLVKAYGYTKTEFKEYASGTKEIPSDLRDECIDVINNLHGDHLKAFHAVAMNFVNLGR